MSTGENKSNFIPVANIKKDSLLSLTNGVEKNMRLSSFGMPRDLSLGGLGSLNGKGNAAKKVYAPNLKVTRNKNVNIKTSKDTSNKFKRFQKDKSARGSGKAGSNLIQTSGLFADGVGVGTNLRKTGSSFGISSGRKDKNDSIIKPTLTKNGKFDRKTDENMIKEYFANLEDVETQTTAYNCPVKLKNENGESMEYKILDKMKDFPETFTKNTTSLDSVCASPKSELFLLQLPNSLPCDIIQNDLNENDSKQEHLNTEKNPPINSSANKFLKDMKEGQIGKLLKYKSGNFKLLLGGTHYNLNKGMDIGFVQEVVSINTNREQRSGNMISLGLVDEKLAAIPIWEILLKNGV